MAMWIVYLGLDEVNQELVRRWVARLGGRVTTVALVDAAALAPDVPVVFDLDHLPEPWRSGWPALAAGRPALAHGYNLRDAEAAALRRAGVTVVRRRLTARYFARWCRSAAGRARSGS
jgi:hypothetical protein